MVICENCLRDIPSILIVTAIILVAMAIIVTLLNYFKTRQFEKKLITLNTLPLPLKNIIKEFNLEDKVVLFNHNDPLAFCLGLINPKIFLSTKLVSVLNTNEIKSVILHEQEHALNKDNFYMMFLNLIRYIFFFFPITNDLVKNFELHREIVADQSVIKKMKDKYYLISALRKVVNNVQLNLLSTSYFSKKNILEIRIKRLMGDKRKLPVFNFKNIIISSSVVILMFVFVLGKTEIHPQSNNSNLLCLDKGSCQNSCK